MYELHLFLWTFQDVFCGLYLCLSWFLGYYCSGGAVSAMPSDGETGNICPVGHYCPLGSSYPVVCPDGTYSNTTGTEHSFNVYIIVQPEMSPFIHELEGLECVKTVPLEPTVYQERVPSSAQQDTTV